MMVILNNMYAGRYITEAGKLGHEIINLFKADDNKFYIWLNSMGICTKKGIGNPTIIMVRSINSKLYKVLAKAVNCKLCVGAGISRKRGNNDTTCQERYKKQKGLNVTYNGKSPKEIFDEEDMFATFVTENVYETCGDVYVTNDKSLKNEYANIFYAEFKIGESMRAYCDDADWKELVNNSSLWKITSSKVNEMVKDKQLRDKKTEFNIFKLIRKDKDELSFSNALAYFLSEDKDGFSKFLKHIEVENDFLTDRYEILREKNNIDISFFGNKHVVVIENKIDSDITVDKRQKKDSQINKAIDTYFATEEEKGAAKNIINRIIDNNGKISQLSKYYIFALAYLISRGVQKEYLGNNIKCFLLVPEYSKKRFTKEYLRGFMSGDKYKLITYKTICEYFGQHTVGDGHYLTEFLLAMKPLTKEFNNEIEEDLKYRFLEKISSL